MAVSGIGCGCDLHGRGRDRLIGLGWRLIDARLEGASARHWTAVAGWRKARLRQLGDVCGLLVAMFGYDEAVVWLHPPSPRRGRAPQEFDAPESDLLGAVRVEATARA